MTPKVFPLWVPTSARCRRARAAKVLIDTFSGVDRQGHSAWDLTLAYRASMGVPVYMDRLAMSAGDAEPDRHTAEMFGHVLVEIAAYLGVPAEHLHIYYNAPCADNRTIAFNMEGSLFFNMYFYETLHQQRQPSHVRSIFEDPECLCYWLVYMAHELAHNIAKPHNKRHENAEESILISSLPGLMRACGRARGAIMALPPT